MKDIYILLGSNRGGREETIARAVEMIGRQGVEVKTCSALYETEPWGFEDPTPFLNMVIEVETDMTPEKLLDQLLMIEVQLGRIRPFDGCGCGISPVLDGGGETAGEAKNAYAGRTIDLDILFYGQQLIFTDKLMIPHPRLHERRFTLIPMNEIAPGFVHPLLKKPISVLLQDCRDQSEVVKRSIQK